MKERKIEVSSLVPICIIIPKLTEYSIEDLVAVFKYLVKEPLVNDLVLVKFPNIFYI